ncbi:p53 and DNA damage-regulated protein 1 isoform X4 [Entelurus aequoreus]|uniref:p53 and DNA damage-regulated protein 1 isoform X4 n=1 Tax=Entelurus aequoreus TaxID=161455 RepID=UPI002B1E55EE|nr:p53 and DNA damage-regulated protein 1 isoform X4 [Entelurus aequoreus]
MDAESQRVVKYLSEVEEAAEDVLTTKQQMVDLDMKRNKNREALNALKDETCSEKVKVCFGNMFIKFPKSKAREVIQKDQEVLDKELNKLHTTLKAKVNELNEMQGKPELRGYKLSPLSTDEMKAINSLLKSLDVILTAGMFGRMDNTSAFHPARQRSCSPGPAFGRWIHQKDRVALAGVSVRVDALQRAFRGVSLTCQLFRLGWTDLHVGSPHVP